MRSRGGASIYNATRMEAQLCDSEEVIVVGGGNSAGQAAVFLAQSSAKVHLFVRSQKLSDSMSQYLIGRIEAHLRIEIHYQTRITGLNGACHLDHVAWRDDEFGETKSGSIRHVFVMAGAAPRPEWLEDSFVLDNRGFIVTGPDLAAFAGGNQWPLKRRPLMLETSVPGIFAVGDTRVGSVKRVASAVRRRFDGSTPRASISCRVRGATRLDSTSANGYGSGNSLTVSELAHRCHMKI
jgi:thioredoxin reductase (NADPH)